jgi:hypothetical protein
MNMHKITPTPYHRQRAVAASDEELARFLQSAREWLVTEHEHEATDDTLRARLSWLAALRQETLRRLARRRLGR